MTDRTMDRWRRRGGAALAAATVGASVLMFVPAAEAALPPAQSTAEVCVEVEAGSSGFTDISGNTHQSSIECVAAADIARGTSLTTFNPGGVVSRGQMASFIARTIDVANELELVDIPALPSSPADKFSDDNGSTHEANINRLAAAGIVNGKSATAFDPDAPVSRAQMATFIANTQKFLSEGTAPFGSFEDFFTDDQTNVHQTNINAIAAAGVAQGVDGVRYQPNAPVLRSQMTTFLARYLGVLEMNDIIAPVDGEDAPPVPPTNATIKFDPVAAERVFVSATSASAADRTYTATGLSSTKKYRVTLFDLGDLSITSGPVFVFAEQGDSGFAAPGIVGQARITSVNGEAADEASQSVGAIEAVDGKIMVVVRGVNFAQLVPVIHEDQGGDETGLNLNDKDQPSEPFGVGGVLEVMPAEGGPDLPAGSEVLLADKDADLIVAGIEDNINFTYHYDTNDKFFIGGTAAKDEVTLTKFEQDLSKEDRLEVKAYEPGEPNKVSEFVLYNELISAPEAQIQVIGANSAIVRVNGLRLGATANVHLGTGASASFAQSPLKASSAEDALPDEPGFQVVLTGLIANTDYRVFVTQTDDGETSGASAAAALKTLPVTPAPLAANFETGRSKVTLTFDRPVVPTETAKAGIKVVCEGTILIILPNPSTFTATAVAATTVGEDEVPAIEITLNKAVPSDAASCSVQLAKDVVKDVEGAGNAAGSKAF